jgi:hypothetical protein
MGSVIDLTGKTFGSLVVIGRDPSPTVGEVRWFCDCLACGKQGHSVKGSLLRDGRAKSCGCLIGGALDLIGQRFERLLVIRRTEAPLTKSGKKQTTRSAWWWCRCDCGFEGVVSAQALRNGMTKSCGCLQKDRATETHKGHEPYEKDPAKRSEYGKLAHANPRNYGSNAPRPRAKFKDTLHNREWLEARSHLNAAEVAREIDCSAVSVQEARKSFGLPIMDISEAKAGRPALYKRVAEGDKICRASSHRLARENCPEGPCVVCGNSSDHVNHIDHDWQHNQPSNLERLCFSCHMRQHALENAVISEILVELGIPYRQIWEKARVRILENKRPQKARVSGIITFNGKSKPIYKWAMDVGISENTLRRRLNAGWSVEKSLTEKTKKPEPVLYQGVLDIVANHARRAGVPLGIVYSRMSQGWTLERALSVKIQEPK